MDVFQENLVDVLEVKVNRCDHSFTKIGFVVMSFLFPAYIIANFAPIDLVFVSVKFNHSEIWNVGE